LSRFVQSGQPVEISGNGFSHHKFATISGFTVAIGTNGTMPATVPLAAGRFGRRLQVSILLL
jgi:hypothetical protein